MKLTVTIEMDNAAFGDDNGGNEAARILCEIAKEIGVYGNILPGSYKPPRDYNGNKVGTVEVSE